jgi:hypothetical protein
MYFTDALPILTPTCSFHTSSQRTRSRVSPLLYLRLVLFYLRLLWLFRSRLLRLFRLLLLRLFRLLRLLPRLSSLLL